MRIPENIIRNEDVKTGQWPYKPEFLWPCFDDSAEPFENDKVCFGGKEMVRKNKRCFTLIAEKQNYAPGSSRFWRRFAESNDIVLVDMFFTIEQYMRIYHELRKLNKTLDKKPKIIHMYCGPDKEKEILEVHNRKQKEHVSMYNFYQVNVCCFYEYYNVHDRFAIMDQEIWHFGAAIGGMHGKLAAFSHGWKDEGNLLHDYFLGKDKA